MNSEKIKQFAKRAWHFIWHEDSLASWAVNVVLAFVIVKFVVYPLLGIFLGTGFPIVAVVSESMTHGSGFDEWWQKPACRSLGGVYSQGEWYQNNSISKEAFYQFSFKNGFDKGDVMVLSSTKNIGIGDILVFKANTPFDPIIHRVISNDTFLTTKGDHNCNTGPFEKEIYPEQMLGKAILRVPLVGWVKIGFVKILNSIGIL
ncbi:MAG: hypothetical protein Q7K43_04610 [Candidatus Woesearchaeota archaeon]|nr:hypothetical protein [Candidatus Woesearchaeota archaeon]